MPAPELRSLTSGGLLVALLASGLLACGEFGSEDGTATEHGATASDLRRRLMQSLGPLRVGDGRLIGAAWAPASTTGPETARPQAALPNRGALPGEPAPGGPGPGPSGDPPPRPLLMQLRRALAVERSPQALSAAALWDLVNGRTADAVTALEEARAAAPTDPGLASDLAAAYLARSGEPGCEGDAFAALEAAAAAVDLAPERADARFNLAVTLERLGLTRQARRAWRSYLALDRSSPWAEEAVARLARLMRPAAVDRWRASLPALAAAAAAVDAAAVAALVDPYRAEARRRVEQELLPAWAHAHSGGRSREAAAALTEARAICAALTALGGDPLPAAAVAAVDQALAGPPHRLEALVRGHVAFRDGLEADRSYEVDRAAASFARAEEALAAGGSPLAGWAGLYRAIQDYRQEHHAQALRRLDGVEAQAVAASSPALAGRAGWIRGLVLAAIGRAWAALSALRWARDRFAAAGEPGHCAVVDGLIADTLAALGEADEALRLFAVALAGLDRFPSVRSEQAILDLAADALATVGSTRAALFLQDEIADRLGGGAEPTDLAFVDLKRSRLRRRIGEPGTAQAELDAAEVHAAVISEPVVRELVETEIEVSRAELVAQADPDTAETALSTAIASFTLRGRPFALTQLHYSRAKLRLAAGDLAGAESDLRASIEPLERQRKEIGEAARREVSFARAGEIFATLVGLLAAQPGRGEEAWAEAERGRARALLDLALRSPQGVAEATVAAAGRAMRATAESPATPARPAPTGAELRLRLPVGVAVVEYSVLPAQTVAWLVRRDEAAELVILPIGEVALRRRVDDLGSAVRGRTGDRAVRSAAGALADAVLAPLAAHLRPGEPLVFVPDGPLVAVPFALLPEPSTGRLLVEGRTLAVAPSAALFALVSERSRSAARAGAFVSAPPTAPGGTAAAASSGRQATVGLLVIGDPAFDRLAFPSLPRLPGAGDEARSVAALHPGARLLLGEEATPAAFFAELPTATVVHFAAHAVPARADPLSTALVLAGAGAGGTLTARDVLALDLRGPRLVVLTACRAAVAGAESEGTWTLAHAFLAAGVTTVVANLWEVDDRAGERLAVAFHRHLTAGVAPAAALRAAQLEMLASPDPRDRDPAAWAGFRVVGAGG